MRARNLLIGFAIIIAGTLLPTILGKLVVVLGALFTWWQMAHVMVEKPWPIWKQKLMQAVLGATAFAVMLSAFRIPGRAVLLALMLGAAIGWFVPYFLRNKNE